MIKDFILPDIGEGVVECELVEWLVKEGDQIAEDQPICDVMTDKALVQIPAPFAGVVSKLYYAKGEIAKVHAPLYAVEIEGEGADAPAALAESTVEAAPAAAPAAPVAVSAGKQVEDFLLPDIGEGIVECELVEWLVNEGDMVEEDQPIADVMTDKALVQIPALKAGKIVTLHYRKGQLAKVHAPLYAIEVEAEHPVATAPAVAAPAVSSSQAERAATPVNGNGKALASPAVRRMARSLDVDLSQVPGSGKHGRVYKEDIEQYLKGGAAPAAPQVSAVQAPATQAAPVQSAVGDRVEPIRGVKAAMARQMMDSVSSIPHFTYCEEIDLTELVALRERMKAKYSSDDLKLTMMPFFMKSLSLALTEFPVVNSQVNADCTELTYKASHNIGMAVDSKVGLLVPNVKDVQSKSILDVAREITRLTDAARSGRVSPADLKGGTISISNIGALGGTVATPIINKPEVAIVALGKLQTLPRFAEDGSVQARKIMQVSWSGDHRVIDGGTIARFCNLWKQYLEQPEDMLLAMR
ncbi:dihydrolipoyllysine-residue acetyltransferase [Shewanella litorisediminis]|uniref:Dihydrolipoamide acetyltransferase component of pyruvate dehydrogenase complex n=1 Tax=Shewanella litorisediminis TaxID=1173586 RepID=A0ABX7G8A3_9GAMM|nr:dihydrolipoyllysine-residue acetyltransferase [Shewanella litorisediminis]MCL2919163.1 dihydrolipoyllysine-residue acetyltransferase [Shewanella litorisediminis]QRH03410.1 dihydrolipoyllysine-residue acetyltransferase [Shewanella litorisediminis]